MSNYKPGTLVIPPKPMKYRRFVYPLWFFWANKIKMPLRYLYMDFRKAIGPRCETCGQRYWRRVGCSDCAMAEFLRQRRLEELRGEKWEPAAGRALSLEQIAELAAQDVHRYRTDTPEGEQPICAYCGAATKMAAYTDLETGSSYPAYCSKMECLEQLEPIKRAT